jgi:Tat protein translocase TatB subunit
MQNNPPAAGDQPEHCRTEQNLTKCPNRSLNLEMLNTAFSPRKFQRAFSLSFKRRFLAKKDSKPQKTSCMIGGARIPMNFSFSEIAFLVLLGMILFGPKRLPEIARQMGKFMAEFKRASNEFQNQIHDEINKLELEEHSKAISAGTSKLLSSDDPDSITAALGRLSDRIKSIPRDFDA